MKDVIAQFKVCRQYFNQSLTNLEKEFDQSDQS